MTINIIGNNKNEAICSVSDVGEAERCKEEDKPLMIVARPLAVPIPRPLIAFGPTRLNLSNTSA